MKPTREFLRRHWRTLLAFAGILVDALLVSLSFLIAVFARHTGPEFPDALQRNARLWGIAVVVFLFFFTSLGIYRTLAQSSFARQTFRAGKGYAYGVATLLAVLFVFRDLDYSRLILLWFFMVLPVTYLLGWGFLRHLIAMLQTRGYGKWNTLAIGSKPYLDLLLHRLTGNPEMGYNLVGVITTPYSDFHDGNLHVERSTVERIVHEKRIELITFSTAQLNGSFEQLEMLCRRRRVGMRVISPEADHVFYRAGIHDLAGISLLEPERKRVESVRKSVKRTFDFLGALAGLILLSPVFLLVSLATKLESPGPIFFKQRRALCEDGHTFEFLKFRSMYHGADQQKDRLFEKNESTGALFKLREDPRVTRVGRFIRRYSIDELPQLINVLRGDMSLVGPRPLPINDFRKMREEDHLGGYYRQRAQAKPGMTGLWQVSGRSEIGFRDMVLLDLYYIEHQSLLYDVEILAQTLPVVVFGRGAY